MSHIPPWLLEIINADPFYLRCCITGSTWEKIDRHHNLIFAGKQVQELWAILPLAHSIHDDVHEPEIKDKCDWVMLNRATDEQLRPYCKVINLIRRRTVLNLIYGDPRRT